MVRQKPKNAGKTFAVRGYAVIVGGPAPVPITGTGVGLGDGRVSVGITVYDLVYGNLISTLALWDPDTKSASTEGSLGSGGWDETRCKDVVVPTP